MRQITILPEYQIAFESVTVDAQGRIIERRPGTARGMSVDLGRGVALELVALPGGEFQMGSPRGQGYEDEQPQHPVTVAPFWLGRYLVTQAQWAALMRPVRSRFQGDALPLDNASWVEANTFCGRLAARTGLSFRLPGEAEWEYACRAGTTTPFSCGETITTDLANYNGAYAYRAEPLGPYRHAPTPVDSFPPNPWGLHDMHGNLFEWCADLWHSDYTGAPSDGRAWVADGLSAYRVARGGSWHDPSDLSRSAARLRFAPSHGDDLVGFRVAVSAWH